MIILTINSTNFLAVIIFALNSEVIFFLELFVISLVQLSLQIDPYIFSTFFDERNWHS